MKIIILIISCVVLSACTPFQKESWYSISGGYKNAQVIGKLTKIIFYGNGFTSDRRVDEYVLLRAAQIGLKRKVRYFSLYQSVNDAYANIKSAVPAIVPNLEKPVATAYILYCNNHQPGDFNVRKIYNRLSKKYL